LAVAMANSLCSVVSVRIMARSIPHHCEEAGGRAGFSLCE
jgi:hypothetical protein